MKTYGWIALLALAGVVWGQPPDSVWMRIYGDTNINQLNDIVPTDDDGFIAVGYSYISSIGRPWVIRLNAEGDTLWTRNWANLGFGSHSVIRTYDGNYALFTASRHIVKFNDVGDTLQIFELPPEYGSGVGICQTTDGNFALLTQWPYNWVFPTDVLVTKINEEGTVLWTRGVVPNLAVPRRIRATADGGCLVASNYLADSLDDFNARVDRLSVNGDSLWTWNHLNSGNDEGQDAVETADGGTIITGSLARRSGGQKAFLAKLNADGAYQWLQTYTTYPDCGGKMVSQTTDGGFVIGAHAVTSGSGGDFYLVRTDHFGYVLWENTYGTQYAEQSIAMCRTRDGGFGMCGWHMPQVNDWDGCVVRIGPDPLPIKDDQIRELPLSGLLVRNYPNPFNATTTLSFSLSHTSPVTLTIFNVLGQAVYQNDLGRLNVGEHRQLFDARELPSGVYVARVQAGERSQMRKMVLLK